MEAEMEAISLEKAAYKANFVRIDINGYFLTHWLTGTGYSEPREMSLALAQFVEVILTLNFDVFVLKITNS